MRVAHITGCLALLLVSACVGQSPPARAQEAATDFNTNQHFGRMELVAERVADATRDKFFERRKLWGNKIQVADTEILSFKMKGDKESEVVLKISWYRVDEGDLHLTTVRQSWADMKGAWKVVNEERVDGDVGLLGDGGESSRSLAGVAGAAGADRKLAEKRRFMTVHLGQAEAPSDEVEDEQLPETPEAPAPAPAAAKTADTKPVPVSNAAPAKTASAPANPALPAPASASSPAAATPAADPTSEGAANTKAESPKSYSAGAESDRRPASGTP